jgi:DNA-binding NarL/FixJ family response regulator
MATNSTSEFYQTERLAMNMIKVLIVDDHAVLRDGIRAMLGAYDEINIVGEASDGLEAIKKSLELMPDVVLMDIAMPGMDGLEATRRIKKKNPRVKVLVLTQYDDRQYILSAIKAGVDGYLPKRAVGSELISAIRVVSRGDSVLYPSAATALINDYRQHAEVETYDRLTARQREILKLIAEGHTSKEIAGMLNISVKTVLGHRADIMKNLGLRNRTELIKYAMREGLLDIDG